MIWLIGYKGMLGSEIARQLSENKIEFVGTDIDVDIISYEALSEFASNKSIKESRGEHRPTSPTGQRRQTSRLRIHCHGTSGVLMRSGMNGIQTGTTTAIVSTSQRATA